jgi:uncharacterized membrane protein YtjA (UPF0391 family)
MSLLKWALVLAILALVAGLLGFTGVAHGFEKGARILFFLFLALVGLFVILGLFVFRKVT